MKLWRRLKWLFWGYYAHLVVAARFFLFRSADIKTRYFLPFLLNDMKLGGEGAEIGVANGGFSEHILRFSKLSCLYSIDPWKEYSPGIYADVNSWAQIKQENNFQHAKKSLLKYKARSKILRLTSKEGSLLFGDQKFDFIYIDADHTYEACKQDLELWWPKLKRGGVFAGHDYLDGKLPQGDFGVKSAVDEFVAKKGLRLRVTNTDEWPTWYVIKDRD